MGLLFLNYFYYIYSYINIYSMTILDLYNLVQEIALNKVEVNSFYPTNPYTAYNQNDIKYSSVCCEITNVADSEQYRTFTTMFYYANRLTENASNNFLIQNTAVNTLSDIIRNIEETEGILNVSNTINYTLFQQKFIDYLAGAYVTVEITIPINNCNTMQR